MAIGRSLSNNSIIVRHQPHYVQQNAYILHTPLSKAASQHAYEAVKYLLEQGADPKQRLMIDTEIEFEKNINNPQYHWKAAKDITGELTEPGCGLCTTIEPIETNREAHHTALTCAIRGPGKEASEKLTPIQKNERNKIISLLLDYGAPTDTKIIAGTGERPKAFVITSRKTRADYGEKTVLHLAIEYKIDPALIKKIAATMGYRFSEDINFKTAYKNPHYTPPWQQSGCVNYLLITARCVLIFPMLCREIFRQFPEIELTPAKLAKQLYKKTDPSYYAEILKILINSEPTKNYSIQKNTFYPILHNTPIPQADAPHTDSFTDSNSSNSTEESRQPRTYNQHGPMFKPPALQQMNHERPKNKPY